MSTNKLFATNIDLMGSLHHGVVSKKRVDREYLLSSATADELNTYRTFSPFRVFADYFVDDEKSNSNIKVGPMGVRSIFNKYAAVLIGQNQTESNEKDPKNVYNKILHGRAGEWRISNNTPLMDNRQTRKAIKSLSDCSIKNLVNASEQGLLGRAIYSYSDFMYCKYLGLIPNNYLITLRRFPLPVDDYISTMGVDINTRKKREISSKNAVPVGCLVTWIGSPGNDMQNILKYAYSLPFKSIDAQFEDAQVDADSNPGFLSAAAAVMDPKYRAAVQEGKAAEAGNVFFKTLFNTPTDVFGKAPYPAAQWNSFKDRTKAYGPVDAIKSTYMRDETGLKFDQNITITFDYELRSYDGINGRQAMLDLLSNILAVTYSTGTFWGGGYRGGGAHQNNIFANLNIFKVKGGFTDYIDAFTKDLATVGDAIKNAWESIKDDAGGSILGALKSIGNQLGGMFMGGLLNRMGRPQKAMVSSLLSPAPVGFWHLTIGNPFHPIMSLGNMILTNTEIEHYGPLGLDDFPTGIKVTCTLTRGKPRDIRDIEKIYQYGNDRIYAGMGPKIFDMYKNADKYKSQDVTYMSDPQTYKEAISEKRTNMNKAKNPDSTAPVSMYYDDLPTDLNNSNLDVLHKYFGDNDTYPIYVASCESEFGSAKKGKNPNADIVNNSGKKSK